MKKTDSIYIAGHRGMVGSAIVRRLEQGNYTNLLLKTSAELDLRRQADAEAFFATQKPAYVFLAAAHVGGILANCTHPADFMYDNMMIEMNVINAAFRYGTKKLLFLGSSCIYPRMAPQPMTEDCLLTGSLEQTNEAYALAKISGLKYCQYLNRQHNTDFISLMPTNLYGPHDNYGLNDSHVLPALLRRIHEAKLAGSNSVPIWGSGKALREFLYVDDLVDACLFMMEHYSGDSPVNIGTSEEVSIAALAEMIGQEVGYSGKFTFDTTKPDGTPRKLLDISKAKKIGWTHKTNLRKGLHLTYRDYLANGASYRL
ncbi:MAG: GDP-L-fucose synthase [Coriobacteriales bacterium]|jgi:GDP-L-fucose synthase|nr:GDP-L-fucose synthase [Coriobacteriales bacterium]